MRGKVVKSCLHSGQVVNFYSYARRQSEQDGWGLLYGVLALEKVGDDLVPYITEKNQSIAKLISFNELMRKENDEFGVLICGIYTEEKLYLASDTEGLDLPDEVIEDMDKKFAFEYMMYPIGMEDRVYYKRKDQVSNMVE